MECKRGDIRNKKIKIYICNIILESFVKHTKLQYRHLKKHCSQFFKKSYNKMF